MKRRNLLISSFALPGSLAAWPALASFPQRPVTVLCPWSAGDSTDTLLRALFK